MSDVFDEYEQQYCMLWENLSKKIYSAVVLEGEKKREKLSEITFDLENAEKLIWKMDLVADSLPTNIKSILRVKLREFNINLKSLKRKIKKITSENVDASTQNDLLEAARADIMAASADQRSRLLDLNKDLSRTTDTINDCRRKMQETEETGVLILRSLNSQRQSFQCHKEKLDEIDDTIIESSVTRSYMDILVAAAAVGGAIVICFILKNVLSSK